MIKLFYSEYFSLQSCLLVELGLEWLFRSHSAIRGFIRAAIWKSYQEQPVFSDLSQAFKWKKKIEGNPGLKDVCAAKFDLLLVSARVGDNRAFETTSGKDVSLPMLIYVNMIFVESFWTEIQRHSSFLLQEWINKGGHLNFVFPFFF